MDAVKLLPKNATKQRIYPSAIVGMRYPYVSDAIGVSFWQEPKEKRPSIILPLRPDNQPGRIGQQSSCVTLHMHLSTTTANPTLAQITIPADAKPGILNDLRRMNVNEFTIYGGLDHLSSEIKRTWEL